MADVLTHIDTLDAELEPPQQQNIEVGATAEQLLPLIDVNQNLATANKELVEQVLPTLRGGLQTKEVSPADIEQVITPDDGYLGLQRVKVAPYEREVQVVNRRANESEFLYYMEDIATQYQRSDYAVCMAGEFYKNADTTILAGADAYLTSDGDFYDAGTTHTWHDDDDIHANRWVVYYFKQGENKSNFMIADATACPNVLAVKGHLGAIIANINVPIQDIIVPDGSTVLDLRLTGSNAFSNTTHIRNILNHTTGYISFNTAATNLIIGVRSANCGTNAIIRQSATSIKGCVVFSELTSIIGYAIIGFGVSGVVSFPKLERLSDGGIITEALSSAKFLFPELREICGGIVISGNNHIQCNGIYMPKLESITRGYITGGFTYRATLNLKQLEFPLLKVATSGFLINAFVKDTEIRLPAIELLSGGLFNSKEQSSGYTNVGVRYIYIGCKGTRSQLILVNYVNSKCDDIEIGDGALQPINISSATGLTRENIVNHILVKLGDNTGQSALTLTLGATNLAKLTDEDKAIATAKNWTLA